jgi:hypothetical protein
MKSIGIITIVKANNYGAELQAFALQRKLSNLGYNSEIIDYLFYKNKGHQTESISRPLCPLPFKNRVKEFLLPIFENIRTLLWIQKRNARNEAFERFHTQHTKFSLVQYRKLSDLNTNPPVYDVYCVGSDQVWNPYSNTSLLPYFLSFVPKGKKISYASSFGVNQVPDNIKGYYKLISAFHSIGVREKSAVPLVRQLADKDATVVLDPTLLLSKAEWNEVASYTKVPSFDYVLLYVLGEVSYMNYITDVALRIARDRNLKVVRICSGAFRPDWNSEVFDILDAGPSDFIGLLSQASVILTKSFHGTVFSIIFEKDFYTFMRRGKEDNTRQIDLLQRLGLSGRAAYVKEAPFNEQLPIDYTQVTQRLNLLVGESVDFLVNAIEN